MKKNLLLSLALAAPVAVVAQTRTVSGRVTAVADGTGLPGVTVLERGTNNGASTDADGNFRLTVQPGATLVFSSIGFATQQVVVGDQSTINLKLQADQTLLNETVIVGYGTQAKADLTGSVTQISSKEVENVPVQSFEQAIQGRTPGVNISQTSGKLGAGLQIRVRGSSSVTASNQPLYVIDGIPVTSQDASSDTEPLNPLADLNPNDIESITILKDASSSAIYGARASNGVILVTTKKGRQGQTKVNVGYYVGTSTATKKRKFLNSAQYKELFSEALNNSGYIGPDPDTQYPTLEDAFAYEAGIDYNSPYNSDWAGAGLRRGHVSQYDFNVSGGDAKTRFFLSANYNDQKGIILGNRYRRGSARLNLDHSIRDNVKVGLNFSLTRSVNDRVSEDNAFSNPIQLNALPPLQAIRTEDGKLNQATLYYNNLLDQEEGRNRAGNYRSFSTAFLSYEPVKGLTLRTEAGADFLNLNEDLYRAAGTQDGGNTGYGYSNQAQVVNYTTNNTATYNRTVAENHTFDALLGFSFQRSVSQQTSAEGRGFPNSEFKRINSAAVKTAGSGSSLSEFAFISYFGRLNYAFKNKYLVSGSVRRDGSSRFGSDNLYGTFGAGSLGWVVSEESFLQDNKVLTFLKLRASYGITGNAEIGNYDSRSLYSAIFYADQAGVTPSTRLGNPRLTWENTAQTDFGVEFGLFDNRINGEVDVYQKNTSDLLLNRQLNYVRGYSNTTENLGKLRNRGLEISLNGLVVDKAVKWNVGGNISFNRNEVTDLVEPIIAGGNTLAQVRSGEPIGVFWGRKYAGVDPENGDALYYTADGTTTNDPTLAAQQKLGNPNPQYTGGVNTSVSWKGLDFTALGQFVYGNDIYNTAGVYQSVNGDYFDNQTIDQLKRWQKPGDITGVPQARLNAANGTQVSSRWVTGGSFFRGKTFTLGYTLPAELSKKGYLSSARIYVSAQNLFTITNYDGYDPEVNTATFGGANYVLGHDFYTPPLSKTFLIGVNLGL